MDGTGQHHKDFRIMGGNKIKNLKEYLHHIMNNQENAELHIGCDSQNVGAKTFYVTTIVLRYQNNGAHVLYHKEKVPVISDLWTKLWGETERSVELANWVKEECDLTVKQIDLDYNSNPEYASNKLLNASTGYITSLGFIAKAKPDLLMAVWAANVLCH